MNGYFNTRSALSSAGLATALPQQGMPVYFGKPANLRRWQAALAKLRPAPTVQGSFFQATAKA